MLALAVIGASTLSNRSFAEKQSPYAESKSAKAAPIPAQLSEGLGRLQQQR
jgi:hypothetical protein